MQVRSRQSRLLPLHATAVAGTPPGAHLCSKAGSRSLSAGSASHREQSKVYSPCFRDAKPINFGRSSPRKLAVHGVDVSRWQGDINWVRLRTQGANFAYIKATDSGDHLDPMFRKNWREAKAAGVKRGAYHFLLVPLWRSQQADWFIRNVPRKPMRFHLSST